MASYTSLDRLDHQYKSADLKQMEPEKRLSVIASYISFTTFSPSFSIQVNPIDLNGPPCLPDLTWSLSSVMYWLMNDQPRLCVLWTLFMFELSYVFASWAVPEWKPCLESLFIGGVLLSHSLSSGEDPTYADIACVGRTFKLLTVNCILRLQVCVA